MSQTPDAPQITGKMFLFNRPELLNKQQHGGLGVVRSDTPFGFCASVRAIPLTIAESPLAMRHYPIIFSEAENPMPLAVVGVIDDVNLFVDDEGRWDENSYVPAYVRRYPFALASESEGDRLAIVIDAESKGLVEGGDLPLFKDGEPTETTEQAIEFCKQFEGERRATEQYMAELKKYDLVKMQTGNFTFDGGEQQKPFAQYFSFDEKTLNELPDEKFNELRKVGLMRFIYAQLNSFVSWQDLMARRARRFNLAEDALLTPMNLN